MRDVLRGSLFYYVLVLPALIFVLALIVYPLYTTIMLGFQNQNLLNPESHFVGFRTFEHLFQDPNFIAAITHSLEWVIGGTVLTMLIGGFIAVLLGSRVPGHRFV
ncbi:MAG: carbohydrate ABC transporter permease, partial [Bacilli bacterium]